MAQNSFKNIWGAANSNVDQQRSDIFLINLAFPSVMTAGNGATGSAGLWQDTCQFAVQDFPFPERTRDTLHIKYLNQTNNVPGADTPLGPINMTVRWAFQQQTAEMLERWFQLVANSQTGGIAIPSQIKSSGYFYWLVPNMAVQANTDNADGTNVYINGGAYYLEGLYCQGLTPSRADMTQSGLTTLAFQLMADRYYPIDASDLTVQLQPTTALQLGVSTAGLTLGSISGG